MKNIKLAVLLLLASASVSILVSNVPTFALNSEKSMLELNVNQDGLPINDASFYGRKYVVFANTTTEALVCAGRCVLDSVLISSGATTNYLIFRNSAEADGNGTAVIEQLAMPGSGANSVPLANFGPIVFSRGITVDASAADNFSAVIAYHYP